MTEDEAKTKHCPVMHGFNFPVRGGHPHQGAPLCIASACMMWQWRTRPPEGADPHALSLPHEAGDGHCGLLRQVW
jgi:hypothetical protein